MSLEQAIIDHTAALLQLSASLNAMNAGCAAAVALPAATGDAELEEAVTKVEKAAKQEKAEAKKPVEKAEVSSETSADAGVASFDKPATQLDYKADVKPTLLKLHQDPRHGADALKALLKKYNAPNGDKIKPEDLGAILADAQALLAA